MRQQWTDYRVFWREFRQTYHSTGALLPSGPGLARALCRYVRGDGEESTGQRTNGELDTTSANAEARRILEVGPGTGAVTGPLLSAMRPADQLVLVERNEQFVRRLRGRLADDRLFRESAPRVQLVHGSIEELPEEQLFDVIVSGLPLNNFSPELVGQILSKLRRLLAVGGTLSFFEYVAVRKAKAIVSPSAERDRLRSVGRLLNDTLRGQEVHRDLVLANVPPAWVHHVRYDA